MTDSAGTNEDKNEKIKVLVLYGVIIACLIPQCLPMADIMIQVGALLVFFIMMGIIKFLRAESEKDSMMYNHATFLSRTILMWSLLLFIFATFGMLYYFQGVDMSDPMKLMNLLSAEAKEDTVDAKKIIAMVISLGPSFFYLFYRIIFGIMAAVKGKGVPRPKGFF